MQEAPGHIFPNRGNLNKSWRPCSSSPQEALCSAEDRARAWARPTLTRFTRRAWQDSRIARRTPVPFVRRNAQMPGLRPPASSQLFRGPSSSVLRLLLLFGESGWVRF